MTTGRVLIANKNGLSGRPGSLIGITTLMYIVHYINYNNNYLEYP